MYKIFGRFFGKISKEDIFNKTLDLSKSARKTLSETEKNIIFDEDVRKIILSKNQKFYFEELGSVKEVVFCPNVDFIGNSMFANSNVEIIELPTNLKGIRGNAFLKSNIGHQIILPAGVDYLGYKCFENCEKLTKIDLSLCRNLEEISEYCFANSGIKSVELPENLIKICDFAFVATEIEKLSLNENLKAIGDSAFGKCKQLEEIKFNDSLKNIGPFAFSGCTSLTKVVLPKNLQCANKNSFCNCDNLRYIKFYKLANVSNAFNYDNFDRMAYDTDGGIVLFDSKVYSNIDNAYNISKLEADEKKTLVHFMQEGKQTFEKAWMLYKQNKLPISLISHLNEHDLEYMTINLDFKQYNQILNLYSWAQKREFIAFFKQFGIFSKDPIEKQKGIEFVKECFAENIFNSRTLGFLSQTNREYFRYETKINTKLLYLDENKELAKFLRNKNTIKKILLVSNNYYTDSVVLFDEKEPKRDIEKYETLFDKICLYYNEVQSTNTNKNGHQLAPTYEKFENYFKKSKFIANNKREEEISLEVGKFYESQEYFENAKNVYKMFDENNVPNHILGKSLNSKTVEDIESIRKEILKNIPQCFNLLSNNEKDYAWELLAKSDVRNVTLGKYAGCCAHLRGMGAGIAIASVVLPNCQNLVIKDEDGNIFGKAILNINKEMGTCLINSLQLNYNYKYDKERAMKAFLEGVYAFKNEYNEINEIPIKKINIGMSEQNSLRDMFFDITPKEKKLLPSEDYRKYDLSRKELFLGSQFGYENDTRNEQNIIFEDK